MKVSRFTESSIDQVVNKFNAAMKKFQEETGVAVKLGRITYDGKQFTSKATFTVVEEGEDAELVSMRHIFEKNCYYYGFTKADWGKEFMHEGTLYKLVGINTRAKRFPIKIKNVRTGQAVKATASLVKNAMSK